MGGKTGTAEMTGEALEVWAKQAWKHLHAGEAEPGNLLDRVDELRAAMQEPEQEKPAEDAGGAQEALDAVLAAEDVPGWAKGLMAATMAQTAQMADAIFALAERQSAATGQEIALKGSVDELVAQLSGTITEGPPPENPLAEPVVFIAKGAMFKAVRKSRQRMVMPNGEQAFTTGITYDFAPSGRYMTIDPSAVTWLEGRPGFGVEYWRQDKPPHAAPDAGLVLDKVLDLALALDDDGLRELLETEQASHKRKIVIDRINQARKRVQGFDRG